MPTLEHNALVDLFRENPGLAPDLLGKLFGLELPPHGSVEVAEASLDQLLPVEFRADLVLELRATGGAPALAIVLEVQRDEDPDKTYSWPVYAAAVRAKKRCPAVVLVVAPDAGVAGWAGQAIDLGLGRGLLAPLVLGPATVPEVTDLSAAEAEAELAVLSALAHGNGPNGLAVLQAAFWAIGRLDREHAAVYFQIVYNGLRETMRRAVEALIMERTSRTEVPFPPFVQQLIERGERKGKREALLQLLARAAIELSEADRARIDACMDEATLDRWIVNVLGAKTAADVLC